MFGTDSRRCMSLATMALPVFDRAPDTAQLLLPSVASSSRGSRAHQGSGLAGSRSRRGLWLEMPGRRRAPVGRAATDLEPRARASAAPDSGSPTIGLSQSLARPARNSNSGSGADSRSAAERVLVLPLRALQRHVHRDRREHRVFGRPRLGRRAQQQVLERRRRQRCEPGVDAAGVGLELGLVVGG